MLKRNIAFGLVVAGLSAACGGTNTPPPIDVPERIIITPAAPFLERGKSKSFTVQRINADLSTTNVTEEVRFTANDTTRSVKDEDVTKLGKFDSDKQVQLVKSMSVGETEIIVTLGDLTATAYVTVTPVPLYVDIIPTNLNLPSKRPAFTRTVAGKEVEIAAVQETVPMSAVVVFEDGTSADVTDEVKWAVGDNLLVLKGNRVGGAKQGVSRVFAIYDNRLTAEAAVNVVDRDALVRIAVYPPSLDLAYTVMDEDFSDPNESQWDFGTRLVDPEAEFTVVNFYTDDTVLDVTADTDFATATDPTELAKLDEPAGVAADPNFILDGNKIVPKNNGKLKSGEANSANTAFSIYDGEATVKVEVKVTKTAVRSSEVTSITAKAENIELEFLAADEDNGVKGVATDAELSVKAAFPGVAEMLSVDGLKLLKWTTSDKEVVGADGIATGVGTATLTATFTSKDKDDKVVNEKTAVVDITVVAPPAKVVPAPDDELLSIVILAPQDTTGVAQVRVAVGTHVPIAVQATYKTFEEGETAGEFVSKEIKKTLDADASVFLTGNDGRQLFTIDQSVNKGSVVGKVAASAKATAYFGGKTVEFDIVVDPSPLASIAVVGCLSPDNSLVSECKALGTYGTGVDAFTQDVTDDVVWASGTGSYAVNGTAGPGTVTRTTPAQDALAVTVNLGTVVSTTLNVPYVSDACIGYCSTMLGACTQAAGAEPEDIAPFAYADRGVCEVACMVFAAGTKGDTTGDSLACRASHAALATKWLPADPANTAANNVHCSHASPSGGGVCVVASGG